MLFFSIPDDVLPSVGGIDGGGVAMDVMPSWFKSRIPNPPSDLSNVTMSQAT